MRNAHVYLWEGMAWAASTLADRFAQHPIAHYEAIEDAAWEGRWGDAAVLVAAVGVLHERGHDTVHLDNRLKQELGFDWEKFTCRTDFKAKGSVVRAEPQEPFVDCTPIASLPSGPSTPSEGWD